MTSIHPLKDVENHMEALNLDILHENTSNASRKERTRVSPTQILLNPPQQDVHSAPMGGLRKGEMSIIRMSNISWELSRRDVLHFFRGYAIKEDGIHIPIDRTTGKTRDQVFIEVPVSLCSSRTLELRSGERIKNRPVLLRASSWRECFATHFPQAEPEVGVYLTRADINAIISICRNYKVYFSRKCAERPFEHVMSILRLLSDMVVSLASRDHLFELSKLSLEALKSHIERGNNNLIDATLLGRMTKVYLQFPFFTEKQKWILYQTSGLETVPGIEHLPVCPSTVLATVVSGSSSLIQRSRSQSPLLEQESNSEPEKTPEIKSIQTLIKPNVDSNAVSNTTIILFQMRINKLEEQLRDTEQENIQLKGKLESQNNSWRQAMQEAEQRHQQQMIELQRKYQMTQLQQQQQQQRVLSVLPPPGMHTFPSRRPSVPSSASRQFMNHFNSRPNQHSNGPAF